MTNGIYEGGEKVATKEGEGIVNKSQQNKEDAIKIKLNSREIKTYSPENVSDGSDAG